jgi:hypothetical protein
MAVVILRGQAHASEYGTRRNVQERRIASRAIPAMTEEKPATDLVEHRQRLNERLRAGWIAGADEEWRRRTGRPMTAKELEGVLRRYPGNLGPER